MCTAVICLLASVIGQPGPVEPKSGLGLHAVLELAPREAFFGDPIFARVTVRNLHNETVPLPAHIFKTAGYTAGAPGGYPYTYRFSTEYVTGDAHFYPIARGAAVVVDYEILECPPVDQFEHDFWRDKATSRGLGITAHVGGPSARLLRNLFSNSTPHNSIYFKARPREEMDFLSELYAESVKRDKAHQMTKGWEELGSFPAYFGLKSLRPYPDLVRKLVAHEESLSPGSLRDIVHLLRLTQTIALSDDEPEREKTVEELLAWLDTLPEIERHCLAMRIVSWAHSSAPNPDEPSMHRLVFEVVQRLPESLYEFEDYRAYRLQGFNRPAFQEYLEQRLEERRRSDPFQPRPEQRKRSDPKE